MALSTARMHRVRGRPPLLAAGINSLIHSHSSSVRSLGYIFSLIYLFYTTPEDFSDRLSRTRETFRTRAPYCPRSRFFPTSLFPETFIIPGSTISSGVVGWVIQCAESLVDYNSVIDSLLPHLRRGYHGEGISGFAIRG